MGDLITRRGLLRGAGTVACSAAAHPLMTSMTFAAAPWDARLVVLILRGGMDGLDAVRPVGDRNFAEARPGVGGDGLALDGFYEMHPGLGALAPLWQAGELGFVQAVSTPYRDKRSHFDGQDMLEAGTDTLAGVRDGWLNRMLQAVPGITAQTSYAIGRNDMRLLQGSADVA
ncbi:MAG: twin-arginine translocation pathway signal, partial [Pseudomonadota bacterium]